MKKGDTVSWNTSQGRTTGTTTEKKTREFTFEIKCSIPANDDPYWIVVSSKTGARAAHKESSLRKS